MFADRLDAGNRLAHVLMEYQGQDVVVYALPRGGVALGVPIASALEAPLDLILVRKIGHPEAPEYAIGAITESGDIILNPAEANSLDAAWLRSEAAKELDEIYRQRERFLQDRSRIPATGKIAIIVDDGLATGLTMEAAITHVSKQDPAKIVVAVPVAAAETVKRLCSQVDEIVTLHTPQDFHAVSSFYRHFDQLTDDEVVAFLRG